MGKGELQSPRLATGWEGFLSRWPRAISVHQQKLRPLCSVSQIRKWTDRVTIDGSLRTQQEFKGTSDTSHDKASRIELASAVAGVMTGGGEGNATKG